MTPDKSIPSRERVPRNTKLNVLARDDYRCVKCGTENWLEVHHIFPLYKGGINNEGNLITLCSKCHHFAPEHPLRLIKYMSNRNRPPIDIAMDLAEKAFISAMMLDKDDYEIAKSDPQGFWKARYQTDLQRAVSWLYDNE